MEKDFSFVMFKINVSGSWANLVFCHVDRYDEVKAACGVLAKAGRGSARFKVLDADGGVIEHYGPQKPNGSYEWRNGPGRR